MKFREIFVFEFKYQLRSFQTWIYFVILFLLPLLISGFDTPADDTTYVNGPSFFVSVTVFANVK